MQTRSQTRNLLLAPTKETTNATKKEAPTKVLSTPRILPESIKNVFYESEYTLYMPQYLEKPLDIDFDEASKAWRENKVYIGNGSFRYKKNKKQRK